MVKFKRFEIGQTVPADSISWFSSIVQEARAKADFGNYTLNEKQGPWSLEAWLAFLGGAEARKSFVLTDSPAWVYYWDYEPEENEFGRVSP